MKGRCLIPRAHEKFLAKVIKRLERDLVPYRMSEYQYGKCGAGWFPPGDKPLKGHTDRMERWLAMPLYNCGREKERMYEGPLTLIEYGEEHAPGLLDDVPKDFRKQSSSGTPPFLLDA